MGSQQSVGEGGFREDSIGGRHWTGLEIGKSQAPSGEEGGTEKKQTVGDVQASWVEPIVICPSVMEPEHPQAVLQVLCVWGMLSKAVLQVLCVCVSGGCSLKRISEGGTSAVRC